MVCLGIWPLVKCRISSLTESKRRALLTTISPRGVRLTPGALLSRTSKPSRYCSGLICALTAGCVTPSDYAALVKLRMSTTDTKDLRHADGIDNTKIVPARTPGG